MASSPSAQLTPAMLAALQRMPVALTAAENLPPGSPSGSTIRALRARGLVQLVRGRSGIAWCTTAAGRAALRDATA